MSVLIHLLFASQILDGESLPRAIELWHRTSKLPDIRPELVIPSVIAAMAAETEHFPAELLLSIAWGESRFEPTTRTGKACGPLQSIGSRADCERWTNPIEGFKAGVAELEQWHADRRTHGELRSVLLAQACGNSAFDGSCEKTRWPGWVIARARRLGMRAPAPCTRREVRPSS